MDKPRIYQYACQMRHDYPGGFTLNLNAGTVRAANENEAVGAMLQTVEAAKAKDGKRWTLYSHVIAPIPAHVVRAAMALIEANDE